MENKSLKFETWRKERAERVILTYLQGLRKISLNWVLGCLKGDFGLSKEEVISIIEKIKRNPSLYLLDKFPERKIRLKKIESALKKWKEIPSAIIPSAISFK